MICMPHNWSQDNISMAKNVSKIPIPMAESLNQMMPQENVYIKHVLWGVLKTMVVGLPRLCWVLRRVQANYAMKI